PIESFWSHIKEEYFQFHNRITKNEMNSEIEECINWYNFNRRQLTLKGMTPIEYRNHASNKIA
ncbi:IS3 family transposase, partial [Lentilactobacillus sp. Marseille-Q4993]|uniref:IS3 family transposase n=1 Tax=Lentilactobacillus sp. Marseille-Q4993 TaxID=3039492 RepID=UPI0024BD264D